MTKLAASSGTVIYEDGNKLHISKRPANWTSTFLFVTGLLAFILLVNGVLQLTVFKEQLNGSSTIGMALIGIGALVIILFWRVWAYRKKARAIPPHQLENIAILDLGNNTLLDGQQNILTPLNQAYLIRKMQITSSSPELILYWNGGSLSIVKGNPFSGGVAAIEKVLSTGPFGLSKGVRKK